MRRSLLILAAFAAGLIVGALAILLIDRDDELDPDPVNVYRTWQGHIIRTTPR